MGTTTQAGPQHPQHTPSPQAESAFNALSRPSP